jgi:hypothetical protein
MSLLKTEHKECQNDVIDRKVQTFVGIVQTLIG